MFHRILTLFIFFSSSCVAQEVVLQAFEADSAASPRGGISYFNTFIQSNLRKPLPAQTSGIGGTVIMNGIVETDGRISNVTIGRSFRPDFDKEALRVFSLFNAWKPAKKAGKVVRQQVTIPIAFKPNTPFQYVNGARISYFNNDGKPVLDDTLSAQYKQITPLDSLGFPSGDVIIYETKNKKWKKFYTLPFAQKEYSPLKSPHKFYRQIGNQTKQHEWQGEVFTLNNTGNRIRQVEYDAGKPTGNELVYHSNGLLAEKTIVADERLNIMKWYNNGQIKQIKTLDKLKQSTSNLSEQVTAFWDSTGSQTVKLGEGNVTYQERVVSKKDTTTHTLFTEKGAYLNTYKEGVWKGMYADSSYAYEELYKNGIFQSGKAKTGQEDTLHYSVAFQSPEFPGGMPGLGKFLSENLSYPVMAQKAGVQGRVFISFVVCTDGTLCDYEVIKSVQPDLDNEALRVVKKMSGKWIAGVQRGKKVRVKFRLPINFSLN